MLPIRDHNPSSTTPFVTWALIVANVAIFLSYWPALSGNEEALRAFFDRYALIPARFTATGEWGPVFSSMFLHGGWFHLIGNMVFLYIFGDNMEDAFGHLGFLLFYLACGVGAALTHVAFSPGSTVPTVGASGAIAGVLGGYLLLYPRARVEVLVIFGFLVDIVVLPAATMLGFWFVVQLINGALADPNLGGVAYWAHAGGFVVGAVLTLPVWLLRGGPGYWARTHGLPPYDPRFEDEVTRVPIVRRRRRPPRW